jgi:hypothetical protein
VVLIIEDVSRLNILSKVVLSDDFNINIATHLLLDKEYKDSTTTTQVFFEIGKPSTVNERPSAQF